MKIEQILERMGGVATTEELREHISERYNGFVLRGWVVARFAREHPGTRGAPSRCSGGKPHGDPGKCLFEWLWNVGGA